MHIYELKFKRHSQGPITWPLYMAFDFHLNSGAADHIVRFAKGN